MHVNMKEPMIKISKGIDYKKPEISANLESPDINLLGPKLKSKKKRI